jgi:uncharacterized protein (TIGR02246 family)
MLHIRCDRCQALWRIEFTSLLDQFAVTLSQKGSAEYGVIAGKAQDLRYWNQVRSRVRKKTKGESPSGDVRTAIDELFQVYVQGLRQGDVTSVVALYTDNAIQLPPTGTVIRGRPQIQESSNGAVQQGFENAILTEREVSASGDVAYECGSYTAIYHLAEHEPREVMGKYLIVLKRTADGWRIDREIWNTLPVP